MSGLVAVAEKPDVLWERPDLERFYARLEDEFELKERANLLTRKLTVISNTGQVLANIIDTARSLRLELMIRCSDFAGNHLYGISNIFHQVASTSMTVDVGKLLPVMVAHDRAGVLFLDRPRWRETALHHICSWQRGRNAMLSKESCAAVLNAGSNLRVSSGLPTDALVELARIARQRGVRLEIKCGLSPDSMVEIAEAGGENVLLDVSDYA